MCWFSLIPQTRKKLFWSIRSVNLAQQVQEVWRRVELHRFNERPELLHPHAFFLSPVYVVTRYEAVPVPWFSEREFCPYSDKYFRILLHFNTRCSAWTTVALVGKRRPKPLETTRAQEFPTDFAAWSKSVMRLWPSESFPNPPVLMG